LGFAGSSVALVFAASLLCGPAVCFVGEEESLEDSFDDLFLVVGEAGGGFELEAEVVVGSAFVFVEEELVAADG